MSELCLSSKTKTQFSSLLLYDFMLFCSFILSHPLYFSYFIFFSPYLLKLLSFLSPLFITTSLLLLALLTISPGLVVDRISPSELSDSKVGFLLTTYHTVLATLRSKIDDDDNEDFHHFEELEAYKIVFDISTFEVSENPIEAPELKSEENCLHACKAPVFECLSHEGFVIGVPEALTGNLEENAVEVSRSESFRPVVGGKQLEGFLKEMDEFENLTYKVEEKEVEPPGLNSKKVDEEQKEQLVRRGSKEMGDKVRAALVKVSTDNGGEYTSKVMEIPRRSADNGGEYTSKVMENTETCLGSNLGSFGSMRKEKEWKRTLACKLFEERHNVDGGEGMDMLWETYESDSSKVKAKSNAKKGKKGDVEYYEDDDDDDDEEMDRQLCCLQALKFSAGKMNLGMGRPSLMRISKALKGIGWLHHVSKHGKKGYN